MSTPTVIRPTQWTLRPDRTPGASGPLREIECTTCLDRSDPSSAQSAPDLWALEHAGRTGHTGYRELVTAFLRATHTEGRG